MLLSGGKCVGWEMVKECVEDLYWFVDEEYDHGFDFVWVIIWKGHTKPSGEKGRSCCRERAG